MKIYIIIFCLFLSLPAYSQTSDHANDTTKVDPTLNYKPRDNHSASGSSISIIKASDLGRCQYQNKLIYFSKEYKNYLDAHNHDDKDVLYILNGKQISGKHDDVIDTLCELPSNEIKNVKCIKNPFTREGNTFKEEIVAIVTRKN